MTVAELIARLQAFERTMEVQQLGYQEEDAPIVTVELVTADEQLAAEGLFSRRALTPKTYEPFVRIR